MTPQELVYHPFGAQPWYHVGLTFGPSGFQKLCLNGALVASSAASGTSNNTFARVSMGAKLNDAQDGPGSPRGRLYESLDDVAFFDTELTSRQVRDIDNAGLSGNGIASLSLAPVPEPSTYAMALAGIACGGFSMWWRRKRS